MIHLQRHVLGKSTMYEFKKKVSQAMERLEKSFVQINVFLSSLFMVAKYQIEYLVRTGQFFLAHFGFGMAFFGHRSLVRCSGLRFSLFLANI